MHEENFWLREDERGEGERMAKTEKKEKVKGEKRKRKEGDRRERNGCGQKKM